MKLLRASRDRGTIIFRVYQSAQQVDRWRVATDADKDAWPITFRIFVEDWLVVLDARLAKINASSEEDGP